MGVLFNSLSGQVPDYYNQKNEAEKKEGRKLTNEEFEEKYLVVSGAASVITTGTSIFDPVLCELCYRWFSREGDEVIDPFAGGSVRGIVAAETGRHYHGNDLRQEQIDANRANAAEVCRGDMPVWTCGDSMNIKELASGEYDFIMTCPPYGDLEVYSDQEGDISNMPDEEFDAVYTEILKRTASMLRNDRFACIVVGNYRDKHGFVRDLVGLTVRAMEAAGCRYYNDFILVTPAGSLPIRIGKQFSATRKMGRTHQYLLVFCKGNPKAATVRLGDVEIPDIAETEDDMNF